MRTVNRSAVVVRPRDPFLKWLLSVDPEAKDLEPSIRDVSVYLVPPDPNEQQEAAPVEEWFADVFERELDGWHRDESRWPVRDVTTFLEWFDVEATSVVVDLDPRRLKHEML